MSRLLAARLLVLPGVLVATAAAALSGGCGSATPSTDGDSGAVGVVRQAAEHDADGCEVGLPSDSLSDYYRKCTDAIGVAVPDFDCDDGTLVPETHLSPDPYPWATCDHPNVLNKECDPGSRFQVLVQTDDVAIVAHCRKKGGSTGYGDIAVIQYNRQNGATCFYQSRLGTGASANMGPFVPRPSDASVGSPWQTPHDTAGIQCVGCHDNGPFVRSPYLAQLRDEPRNRLPGTNAGPGPWDQRFTWNRTLPYRFVGNDFQSWKSFSVTVPPTAEGAQCLSCHRMGMAKVGESFSSLGTAMRLGNFATAPTQAKKNPHSADSPIWMLPGQVTYSPAAEAQATAIAKCARAIFKGETLPGCNTEQIAQGTTCRGAPVRGVVNGETQGDVVDRRTEIDLPISMACEGDKNCTGMCGWKSMHGPFWQSEDDVPVTSNKFVGTALQLYVDGGRMRVRSLAAPHPGEKTASPGGMYECLNMNELVSPPPSSDCTVFHFDVKDPDGSRDADETRIDLPSFDVLTGFIGNVAQRREAVHGGDDFLRVYLANGTNVLAQQHSDPPYPLKRGPLKGEAMAYTCDGWSPTYLVRDAHTTSDIELVPPGAAANARCFITGISGAWSSTRDEGRVQPFAQIYSSAGALRMRVQPGERAPDSVTAWASFLELRANR